MLKIMLYGLAIGLIAISIMIIVLPEFNLGVVHKADHIAVIELPGGRLVLERRFVDDWPLSPMEILGIVILVALVLPVIILVVCRRRPKGLGR